LNHENQPSLSNRQTNWGDFRCLINEKLSLIVSFKTEEDNEAAVKFFNDTGHVGMQGQNIQTLKAVLY
jgi:hypothetical protein